MQPTVTALPVFDAAVMQQQFNVILIRKSPCGGAPYYNARQPNHLPMSWERACQWVREITEGLGDRVAWQKDGYVSIYIEPANLDYHGRRALYTEMMQLLLGENNRAAYVEGMRLIYALASPQTERMAYRVQELHRDLAGRVEERSGCSQIALGGEGNFGGKGVAVEGIAVL